MLLLLLLRLQSAVPAAAARRAGGGRAGAPQHALNRPLHRRRERQARWVLRDARVVALGADGDRVVVEDAGDADD